MKVTKSTKKEKVAKVEAPEAAPQVAETPQVIEAKPTSAIEEIPKVKPKITLRAQPITSTPQMVQRQSNQAVLLNIKTGKRTPMSPESAARMVRKYQKEFKIL